jgi:hypothetical protein
MHRILVIDNIESALQLPRIWMNDHRLLDWKPEIYKGFVNIVLVYYYNHPGRLEPARDEPSLSPKSGSTLKKFEHESPVPEICDSYIWAIGCGLSVSTPNPSHGYPPAGTDVCLCTLTRTSAKSTMLVLLLK